MLRLTSMGARFCQIHSRINCTCESRHTWVFPEQWLEATVTPEGPSVRRSSGRLSSTWKASIKSQQSIPKPKIFTGECWSYTRNDLILDLPGLGYFLQRGTESEWKLFYFYTFLSACRESNHSFKSQLTFYCLAPSKMTETYGNPYKVFSRSWCKLSVSHSYSPIEKHLKDPNNLTSGWMMSSFIHLDLCQGWLLTREYWNFCSAPEVDTRGVKKQSQGYTLGKIIKIWQNSYFWARVGDGTKRPFSIPRKMKENVVNISTSNKTLEKVS